MKYSVARIPRVKVSKEDTLKGQAMVSIPESAPCILIVLIYPRLFLSACYRKDRRAQCLNNKLWGEQKTCIIQSGNARFTLFFFLSFKM